ncbi:MAG: class I SAM-dependent methyltransferase [Betaproteobacteria bacterium]|nr:class I SAM-dependent methyltransferase [Betaproteobacteria bacterium]
MSPDDYDAWYRTSRGAWIGDTEFSLLGGLLAPRRGESLLDVGCGTGYFSRRFAGAALAVTGIDADPGMIEFARTHAAAGERYLPGDARRLPFPDRSFDLTVSVTALCFISEEVAALGEIARVTRRRFALGLLNRHSLLYLQKGRDGGSGAYRGAHWHTDGELRELLAQAGIQRVASHYAIFVPAGGGISRLIENVIPRSLPLGAFIAVAGEVPA